ncbi:MAG: aminotransferase class IV [Oligoflexia bacterium]|nr:aminotransferase class IV [Oligoflexia bacterium]
MSDRILANWNGATLYLDEIKISPLDRGFIFGDAVYEVIRIYRGNMWLAQEHFDRLERSLRSLEINADLNAIKSSLLDVFTKSSVVDGFIYLQVSRGTAPRTHYFPAESVSPNYIIWCQKYDDSWLYPFWENGISVISTPDLRWARRDIKTVNLLGNCLAMEKAKQANASEAILIDKDGTVSEATSNNVFGVKDGVIFTTPNSHKILPGITREYTLTLAKEMNIPVIEKTFTYEELLHADELFITGSIMEIMPVTKVDQCMIRQGVVGRITRELMKQFFINKNKNNLSIYTLKVNVEEQLCRPKFF